MSVLERRILPILLCTVFLVISAMFAPQAGADECEPTIMEEMEQSGCGEPEEEHSGKEEETAGISSFSFWDFFRTIAAFLFVAGLLYILLKFIGKKSKTYQKGSLLHNLGGTSLGGNKSIQLVKIGSRIYIVGVGQDVKLLGEITEEKEIKSLLKEFNEEADRSIIPTDIFSQVMKKGKKSTESGASLVDQLKRELKEMKGNRNKLKQEMQKKVKPGDE